MYHIKSKLQIVFLDYKNIKLIQITSQYVLPRLKATYNENKIQDDIPIFIDIVKTDKKTGENYVSETYKNGIPVSSFKQEKQI